MAPSSGVLVYIVLQLILFDLCPSSLPGSGSARSPDKGDNRNAMA